jgi:hypothetical protein
MAQSCPPQRRGKAKVMQTMQVIYGFFKSKPPGDLNRLSGVIIQKLIKTNHIERLLLECV